MITAPVFSHRDFALCLSWTEKHSAVKVTVDMKHAMLVIYFSLFVTHCLLWSLILCSPELLGWPILAGSETSR